MALRCNFKARRARLAYAREACTDDSRMKGNTVNITTQIIPVTLLHDGDWYYPVVQATGEVVKGEGMNYIVKAPRIDRNTGCIYAVTDKGRIDWQNGATVAREVK